MSKIKPATALKADKTHTAWPPEQIPWESTDDIPRNSRRIPAQPRVLQALDLALRIRAQGYHVFLSGEPTLGRTYMVHNYLAPKAKKEPTPPDLIYVNDFDDPDSPCLLQVPAGHGRLLKRSLAKAFAQIKKEVQARFEGVSFVRKRGELLNRFHADRTKLIGEMDNLAGGQGFNLDVDEQGSLTLYPLLDGKKLSGEEFENLNPAQRNTLKRKSDSLLGVMTGLVHKLTKAERDFRFEERDLERQVIDAVLDRILTPVVERACKSAANNGSFAQVAETLQNHFKRMRQDILDNSDLFFQREPGLKPGANPGQEFLPPPHEPDFSRYDINLFVDNGALKGAPIVADNNPTFSNLLGSVGREAEMGALVTDFTLIKAGSLHRANGGYLILHLEDLLHAPGVWEGLVRALRAGSAKIEESPDGQESRTKGIEPEPLPLNLKVILIGPDGFHESMLMHDERFAKLFKIKAQMMSDAPRTRQQIRAWLLNLANIADETELLPFGRDAMAALVDFASRLCEDQKKISLKFPLIREVMIESSTLAEAAGLARVDQALVAKALDGRDYRASLVEDLFMEEYDREMLKLRTDGKDIGRVNGLSLAWNGEFEFGLPHEISCTVGVGHGGIIDLEREAELGGPIHTKAMLILKSYLVDQFAHNKPLVLTGSICFEQNYSGIEGDSASGAELASLLSALSETPIRLSLAFTGAVNQSGQILAVGGVSRKIKGFFNLCSRRGLTGEQGVIIPKDNVDQLMLEPQIVEAIKNGKFSIYPVTHISQALELLTGIPTGKRLKNGRFSKNSLFARVDDRLHHLGWLAENSFKQKRK